ncbi:hypothetical protein BCU12_17300 [Vibrio sp. 10N.261.55.A7]|nr:hypothetical protein BCU12_17300 [Vibrio sp. 10N.261.55.A7]
MSMNASAPSGVVVAGGTVAHPVIVNANGIANRNLFILYVFLIILINNKMGKPCLPFIDLLYVKSN